MNCLRPGRLRPGNLFKDFWVENKNVSLTSRGRAKSSFDKSSAVHFLAVLAEAKPTEIERFRQLDHTITHTITQQGRPKAMAKDRLIHGGRIFYVQGVDEPGELGLWTIYFAEERSDVDGINLKDQVGAIYSQVAQETKSRAYRAAIVLHASSRRVLKGDRSGKVYKKPGCKEARYRASAPGEPPAVRLDILRVSWKAMAQSENEGESVTIHPAIWTDVKYAPNLQSGTNHIAPRPFAEPIVEKVKEKIIAIYKQPYFNK